MNKKIAAFGEVMMRLEVPGNELLVQGNSLKYSFSGSGVNVISALSQWGHSGYLVSTLPGNVFGDAAHSYLRKLGISTSFINHHGSYLGMYFLENGFGNRPSRVTYTNRLDSSFNSASIENYDFETIGKTVDYVHFCGITLAINDQVRSQMKHLANKVKQNGGKVVFDCNYRPSLWGENGYKDAKQHYEDMLKLSDIVLMNEKDAIYILGMDTEKVVRLEQLTDLIPQIADKFNIHCIAGTHRLINKQSHSLMGFLYKNQRFTFSETVAFPVLDRIGAGDAYASGIIHGEIKNYSLQKTVSFSIHSAILAHTIMGDTPIFTEADVHQAMQSGINDVWR